MSEFEVPIYNALLIAGYIIAPITFIFLLRVSAPYGRHARKGWGPQISRRAGWVIMELPSVASFGIFFLLGLTTGATLVWIAFALWQTHYVYRGLVYPFRIREKSKSNPVIVVVFAVLFTTINGYLNGRYLSIHADRYDAAWVSDPRFAIGLLLFVFGLGLNFYADEILLHLRRKDESGYRVPHGGPYRFVSCPNYLGELIEWTGWAILVWSPVGLLFAIWTAANLIPRARSHHAWYRAEFPDYPQERKALIPFIY